MKIFLAILGCVALVLGIVGIFVPLLPTTPFLLLAAALWVRSSPRLYEWLITHRYFGEYIRNFRENRAIPMRAKIISIALMWGTMLYCVCVLLTQWWWAQNRAAGGGRRRHVAYSLVRYAPQIAFAGSETLGGSCLVPATKKRNFIFQAVLLNPFSRSKSTP